MLGTDATVANAGTLAGKDFGAYFQHSGTFTNAAGGLVGASTGFGIYFVGGAGTVENAGSIAGGTDAIKMAAGFANRLIVDPGAVFAGLVEGGNTVGATAVSTLELASGAPAGTLSSLGSQFVDFTQVTVDAGASWTFDSTDTLVAGATLNNAGLLTGPVTMQTGASLTNAATGTIVAPVIALVGRPGGALGIVNLGSIIGTAGYGVLLNFGGTVSNASSGTVYGGIDGIDGSNGTVANSGTIAGGSRAGIFSRYAGTIVNASGGTISGGTEGIYGSLFGVTVDNAGSILGTGFYGIKATSGGSATNRSSGTIAGHFDGINMVGAAGTVVNDGAINGHVRDGIYLGGGGSVANTAGGTVAGYYYGIIVQNHRGTVVNAGTVSAAHGQGIALFIGGTVTNASGGYILGSSLNGIASGAGGSVTNAAGAIIVGFQNGISLIAALSTVFNDGTITGSNQYGVYLSNGSVTNAATGAISGYQDGVVLALPGGVYNAGSITAAHRDGLLFFDGGSVTNAAGGAIAGGRDGVEVAAAPGDVINEGAITGSRLDGIYLGAGGSVTNASGGSVYGGTDGIDASNATIVNSGTIAGGSRAGIYVRNAGTVVNTSGGAIAGGVEGVYSTLSGVVVDNAGTIQGTTFYGIKAKSGESVTNQSSGTITGHYDGINIVGAVGAVVNYGAITGTRRDGIYLGAGGSVANRTGGTVAGNYYGILVKGAAGTVANASSVFSAHGPGLDLVLGGSVTNAAGAYIGSGTREGVLFGDAATLTDAGTIVAGSTNAAVAFANGFTNRLILGAGAAFVGIVDGGNDGASTAVSTLELSSGASRGTLSGLGSQFTHFARIVVDSGADWALAGTDTLAAGVTVTDDGTLTVVGTLINATQLTGPVSLAPGAYLFNAASATAAVVGLSGGGVTVVNAGSFYGVGTHGYGAILNGGGTITNLASGTIGGTTGGITIAGGGATIIDSGSISGGTYAVAFAAGYTNRLILDPGAVLTGTVDGGTTAVSTLELASGASAGTLSGLGQDGVSIYFPTRWTNFAQVTVDAGAYWVLHTPAILEPGVTLANAGTLQGIAILGAGAVLSNAATGTIASSARFTIFGDSYGASTIVNAGLISGEGSGGILLQSGGFVTNFAGGTITGTDTGIESQDAATVVNAGSVGGGTLAVLLAAGYTNRLIVDPGAVFAGTVDGGNAIGASAVSTLELASAATAGTLSGLGSKYIDFASVTVDAGASWTLAGTNTIAAGVTLTDAGTLTAAGTLNNAGQFAGPLTLAAGAVLSNATTGTITATGTYAVFGLSGGGQTIVNAGRIYGSGAQGHGVVLNGGGTIVNAASGSIGGAATGIVVTGGGATIVDAGSISGGTYAVSFAAGYTNRFVFDPSAVIAGTVDGGNSAGSTAVSTLELGSGASIGTLSGLSTAFTNFAQVTVDAGAYWALQGGTVATGVTLTNAGTVQGSILESGGVLTNVATGTILSNSRFMVFCSYGGPSTIVNAGSLLFTGGVAIRFSTDGGSVTNVAGGVILAHSSGIASLGATTVVNAGTIAGSYASVQFNSGYTNRLIVDPGAVFSGAVMGGNAIGAGAVSTLELAFDTIAGTISGIGSQYTGFGAIEVDLGATWTLAGTNTFASGVAVTDHGRLVVAGALTNATELNVAVTLAPGGYLSNAAIGTIASTSDYGVIAYSGGPSTIVNAGTVLSADYGVYLEDVGTVINTGLIQGTGYGVYARAGGYVSNASAGTITGAMAVYFDTPDSTLVNAGVLEGTDRFALKMERGGLAVNVSGGTIAGSYYGLGIISQPGTVRNAGVVVGTSGVGVYLKAGGSVANATGASITGHVFGIYMQGGGGTVVNAGSIVSETTAVRFAAGYTNRLIVDPGAVFAGIVGGGNTVGATAVSTLELASAATAGTLSGLGSHYIDFASIALDAGASWTLTGSNTLAAGTTLTNAGTLSLIGATLADAGVLINNGKVIVDPSSLTLASLAGTGTTTIDPGSTLNVTGSVASGATIGFTGTGGVLGINPGQFAGRIVDFSAGDTLLLNGVTAATSATIVNGNTLEILQTGGPAIDLTLDNGRSFAGGTFTISPSGVITTNEAPCFLRDTRIRTDRGEIAVQDLAVGDRVETLSGALRPIVWIGTGRVLVSPGRRSAATPVIVRKGALADNVPHRDLRITKGHSLYVDGVLIPAEFLINHRTILWDDRRRTVEFYHIELDAHDVLLAEGAPSESYRDDGNRWLFENANSGWDLPPKPAFAPVLTGGPFVDAAWRRIVDRAGPRAEGPVAADPDLHLCVDGQRIDALSRNGRAWHFRVPPNSVEVRIVSRSGIPSEMGTLRDSRRLGVAIERIGLWQGTRVKRIDSADGALEAGFHAHEPDNGYRWTDGDALLPLAWFVNFESSSELLLDVRTMPQYPGDTAPEVRAA